MKYAIVKLGGKQFKITEGLKFDLEKQSDLSFEVLYYTDGKEILVGEPVLNDIKVKAKIVEDKKDKKIRIGRFKSKSRYRKIKGHRQPISVVEIESITKGKVADTDTKEEKKEVKKTTPKKSAKTETKETKKVKSSSKDEK